MHVLAVRMIDITGLSHACNACSWRFSAETPAPLVAFQQTFIDS
jgi:hypothetical protein